MKTEKWFYPIQENLNRDLHEMYETVTTAWQEVTSNRVYECKFCKKADSGTVRSTEVLLCVMTKATDRYSIFKCIIL